MVTPKVKPETKRALRLSNSRLLSSARRILGLRVVKKQIVFAAAAQRLGRPRYTGTSGGYELLRQLCSEVPVPSKKESRKLRAVRVAVPIIAVGPAPFEVTDAFLASYEWRRLRMMVIKERGRRCECCGAVPTPTNDVVINVDHIKPRRLFPELALTKSNLQVLCGECNHGKGNWDQTDWRNQDEPPTVDFRPVWAQHMTRQRIS